MPNTDYAYWVSQNVFSMYQLMFAIITPALIVGAIAERMKFSAIMLFLTLWMFVVTSRMAHMVWGVDGFMNGVWNADANDQGDRLRGRHRRAHDLGLVGAVLCLILGKRKGFGKSPFAPHSMVLSLVGTGMLWVGWYGFNAGSAVAADASPPTPSPPPRSPPRSPASFGRRSNGSRAASRPCSASAPAPSPVWS